MFYRITLDLAFPTIAHAQAVQAVAQAQFPFAIPINLGHDYEEPAVIMVQKCYHDEDPVRPCDVLVYEHNP